MILARLLGGLALSLRTDGATLPLGLLSRFLSFLAGAAGEAALLGDGLRGGGGEDLLGSLASLGSLESLAGLLSLFGLVLLGGLAARRGAGE